MSATLEMQTTRVSLPDMILFKVAEICAENVLAAVVDRHLQLTGNASSYLKLIPEVRAVVRSLSGEGGYCSERRHFVLTLKYCFKEQRRRAGHSPRWQDHLREVLKAHPEYVTTEAHEKLKRWPALHRAIATPTTQL